MGHVIDFVNVSTKGLESSPYADALAGVRANEARYYKNKYDHTFETTAASSSKKAVAYLAKVLKEERGIVIAAAPLETSQFVVDDMQMTYVFFDSGLSINVMWPLNDPARRAVGFKLCEGMEVPEELSTFKFARQKSKLAGTIRGSYFKIKGDYPR